MIFCVSFCGVFFILLRSVWQWIINPEQWDAAWLSVSNVKDGGILIVLIEVSGNISITFCILETRFLP